MSELVALARPYAKAAFAFAIEHQDIMRWQSMLAFSAEVTKNKQISKLLHGLVSTKKLEDVFIAACGDQLNVAGQNLIRVMAKNGRLVVLPHVIQQFEFLYTKHKKIAEVNVISSFPLKKEQKEKIISVMERRLLFKINLHCKIDTSIIAGIVIRVGNMTIDGSVQNRLKRFMNILQS